MNTIDIIRNSATARLPATYENAKTALAECASVDECLDWQDKAAALASYARQRDDDTLMKYATRIQGRAARRAAELLKQFPEGTGRNQHTGQHASEPTTRRQAALDAGLSRRQYNDTMDIAKVPEAQFEALVESDNPPTPARLAAIGRGGVENFQKATSLISTLRRFADFCEANDPVAIATSLMDHEIAPARDHVATIDRWLDRFIVNLKEPAK